MTRTHGTTTKPLRGVIALGMLLTLTSVAPGSAPMEQPDDDRIAVWVREAIEEDPRAGSAAIRVEVNHGVASLFGTAESLAARKFAVLQAKKILGVLGVIDLIEIQRQEVPDAVVVEAVRRRLESSAAVDSSDLRVAVDLGEVTLSGRVGTLAEQQQAELLAMEVRGVTAVDNRLEVDAARGEARSDAQIEQDVLAALGRDVYLNGLPISVRVGAGSATLTGVVGSAYEKERASSETGWISGVTGVDNQLRVVWWGDRPTRIPRPEPVSDDALRDALLAELAVDDRLDAHEIDVSISSGHVRLRGVVPTEHQRKLAEENARNVVGVGWLTNELRVVPPDRPDGEMLEEIRDALAADSTLHASGIRVSLAQGVASLEGSVASRHAQSHAGAVASRVRGVRRVDNRLVVTAAAEADDDLVKEIRERIDRDWRTAFASDRIQVVAKAGVVALSGTVERWSERRSAERIAARTPGVRAVVNQIAVEPYPYPWEEQPDEPAPRWDPYYFDFPELPWIAALPRNG